MFGYSLRYVPTSIGAAVGTGTHAVVAFALKEKMKTGVLAHAHTREEFAMAELDKELEHETLFDPTTRDRNTAQKQVVRQSRVFLETTGERIDPVAVEQRLVAKHKTGLVVSGRQDVVVDYPAMLRDLKTGVQSAWNGAQYGGYDKLLDAHALPIHAITEDYVKRVRISNPQPPPVEIKYDREVCEQAFERGMASIARDIKEFRTTKVATAFTANPFSMLCSDKYCPAWGTDFCLEHRK